MKLLSHPLVTYLLRYKWRRFGRMVYYSRLVLYILFLFFLTGYAMVTATDVSTSQCRQDVCVCNVTFEGEPTGSEILWRTVGRPVVLTTTSISLFLEVRRPPPPPLLSLITYLPHPTPPHPTQPHPFPPFSSSHLSIPPPSSTHLFGCILPRIIRGF